MLQLSSSNDFQKCIPSQIRSLLARLGCANFTTKAPSPKEVNHEGRHSSVDSSAPCNLRSRVQIPRTPSVLFLLICRKSNFALYLSLRWKRTKIQTKRGGFWWYLQDNQSSGCLMKYETVFLTLHWITFDKLDYQLTAVIIPPPLPAWLQVN